MPAAIDMVGQVVGRWTVIARGANYKNGDARWVCRCECGTERLIQGWMLRGRTTGGCVRCGNDAKSTHGHTKGGRATPMYMTWVGMIARCTNAHHVKYHLYGGRGISVCARWLHSFSAFVEDMGTKPSECHSLDRINGDGDYEPGNCRWATLEQQNQNRSTSIMIECGGLRLAVSEWARRTGIPRHAIYSRLRMGWDPIKAITSPVRETNRKKAA
jgi:hypothetical protein